MATLTIEITEASKQLVDEQVASGRFHDASALFETLLNQATWLKESIDPFTDDERKRINAMLREAQESYEQTLEEIRLIAVTRSPMGIGGGRTPRFAILDGDAV